MSNSKICILEHTELGKLFYAFKYTADTTLRINKAIVDYLASVHDAMKSHLECIKRKLKAANEEYSAAQSAEADAKGVYDYNKDCFDAAKSDFNSCKDKCSDLYEKMMSSKRMKREAYADRDHIACAEYKSDEQYYSSQLDSAKAEKGAAKDSMDYARNNLEGSKQSLESAKKRSEDAFQDVKRWEANCQKAESIVSACNMFRSDWADKSNFEFNRCGEILEMQAQTISTDAPAKLQKIIDKVEEILSVRFSDAEPVREKRYQTNPHWNDTRYIHDRADEIKKKQEKNLRLYDIKQPVETDTYLNICPKCGFVKGLTCLCKNKRFDYET